MVGNQDRDQRLENSSEQEEWSFLWIVMILIVTLTGLWFMWQNQVTGMLH